MGREQYYSHGFRGWIFLDETLCLCVVTGGELVTDLLEGWPSHMSSETSPSKSEKVPVEEYEFPNKLANVQSHLEKLVANNYYLNKSAKDAYRSYILAYNSHSMKDVFNVHRLDLQEIYAHAHKEIDAEAAREKILALDDSGNVEPSELIADMDSQIVKAK